MAVVCVRVTCANDVVAVIGAVGMSADDSGIMGPVGMVGAVVSVGVFCCLRCARPTFNCARL